MQRVLLLVIGYLLRVNGEESMDAIDAIKTRRSIRKYSDQPVPEEIVQDLLHSAFVAPSALDERPWHFVVIRDKKMLENLGGRMDGCEMLQTATLGILLCGDESLEQIPGYWVQDCSACAENILLAAHAQGLGACWIATIGIESRVNLLHGQLGIPREVIPFALISMGYPDEQLPGEDRYDVSRVHNELW